MTLSTYATLKTAIASYLERTDLTSQIVDAITLAQSKMYRGVMNLDGRTWRIPPLRVRDMITTANITITSGAGSLPSGWLESVRLWPGGTDEPDLEYIPPQDFYKYAGAHQTSGTITGYTIEGATIRTLPAASDTIASVHYAIFTAMSADADHDWIVDNAPHVYLYGALAEAWGFIGGNDNEQMKYEGMFAQAIHGLNAQYGQAQRSGSSLIMRPKAVV